jgi:hypothetical protein
MAGRGSIGPETTIRLWVAAGGRCEYCNRYLLEDEFTTYAFNLSERAHIVGASEAEGSPRGRHPLPLAERNQAENLILLCREHHRLIDRLIEEHTVEGLGKIKRDHEQRIRLLTGLTEEVETLVLRAVGGIRGAPVEIPAAAVLPAVRADGRFPRYRFALAGEDLEVDLRALPDEGEGAYWQSGERVIAERLSRLRDAQAPINHISVFALSRIPFLVALGFHLDDKIPTTIYGRRRDGSGDRGWGFDREAKRVDFALQRIGGPDCADHVVLAISATAPIGAEVAAVADDAPVYELTPVAEEPGRDLFSARASLDAFADTYHRFLALVEGEHPDAREIHAYLAAPACAAVQLGRGLMRDVQPALVVFDRDAGGVFKPTLRLQR